MSAYRQRQSRPDHKRADGTRGNQYAGPCAYCGQEVPAMTGDLRPDRDTGRWQVYHRSPQWVGSPVSGCPGEADKLNEQGGWNR